jgi:cytochrome c-type biogenesis protein CcmH/NrfG
MLKTQGRKSPEFVLFGTWDALYLVDRSVTDMEKESADQAAGWTTIQVYAMAAVCLVVGLAVGYLFRGSAPARPTGPQPVQAAQPADATPDGNAQAMPTLEQMKTMADKKAEPLLAQLKAEPKNADLLIQIGRIYQSTHQFKQAADYYDQSLEITPKNNAVRTELSSCLYYDGDVDGAIRELQTGLKNDPNDANALFNLGMIRWKGKNDKTGAIVAWRQLLRTHPNLDRKPIVEQMIAEAQK